ncbi:MAG: ABC transporter permease [Verrucomicrobia bacterium]|nr:ABC transporter permease [Verrucomicrobiota bacterium]
MSPAAEHPPVTTPPELVLEAGRAEAHYWRDLWRYRELLGFLAWRDIKVRYKQTVLGAAWALLQPAVTLVVFTFVFSRLAKMPSGSVPYPLMVMAGLLPWQLFANALTSASGSLVSNTHLISKVYFPRLVVPLSALAVALVDFAIVGVLYVALSAWWSCWPDWRLLLLPAFMVLGLLAALGAGLWLTALTVRFRDFRFIVPFLLQLGVFLSPVGFSTSVVPSWRLLFSFNPMVAVIDGFRWCLLRGAQPLDAGGLLVGILVTVLLLATGLWYFRRTEKGFADII